ncbi:DNA (cytosine-5-)-methyltransferase [Thiomicrorhabdus aquaedulcis]|uniref:DNA (cytosine-5-)-methyltransferase n=1 Tax=Thiomicrorhabdus aquaedulcis TaxID=2211106 RepID=UPI000FD73E93|nr:DNA (cytosine-5-)-methyltransferase [Thiomicrorhabdus aquaedulcis]
MKNFYSLAETADLLTVSKETLRRWDDTGKLKSTRLPNNYRVYTPESLKQYVQGKSIFELEVMDENHYIPIKPYSVLELFAGAGGMALGLEKAGMKCQLLNELDKTACKTLKTNRPDWNVVEGDVAKVCFKNYFGKIDVVTGGFPCQAFSYAGKKLGLEDARGTLFYEFARAVKETQPLMCVGENVKGLVTHDDGKTLKGMIEILSDLGYDVLEPQVLKSAYFKVPQKRERLFLIGIRRNSGIQFNYPKPMQEMMTLTDALKAGILYATDVPESPGQRYPARKKEIMDMVPPGGYWRDLPEDVQKEYMLKSYYLGGGKTGMARRISWDEPCLTLTTSPAQKQTERCHPDETRPFTVKEYARIQTFPDDWQFMGSMNQIYKQIGNAVPVNLAHAVGKEVVKALNQFMIQQELRAKFSA